MGKYRYYWYETVRSMLRRYNDIPEDASVQECIFQTAVRKAIKETEKMEDGNNRIRAVKMIYIDRTHSVDGVVNALGVASKSTVERWCRSFITLVGKNAGY